MTTATAVSPTGPEPQLLTGELDARLTKGPVRFDYRVQTAGPNDSTVDPSAPWQNSDTVTIDLTRLRDVSGPERDLIRRFVSMIQVQRQDFNGQLITIR